MKLRHLLLLVIAVTAATMTPRLAAQSAVSKNAAHSQPALTAVQALPLTCAEAWIASEKDYAKLRVLVVTLAKVSLVNRELTFPNEREAGLDAGKGIAADCKADPDALLFAIVDKHVRRLATPARP